MLCKSNHTVIEAKILHLYIPDREAIVFILYNAVCDKYFKRILLLYKVMKCMFDFSFTSSVFQHFTEQPWSGYKEIDRGLLFDLAFTSAPLVNFLAEESLHSFINYF